MQTGARMFTAEQYRAKAAEYAGLLEAANSPAEAAEFRDLRQSYASLAENLDWLAANATKTVSPAPGDIPPPKRHDESFPEQQNILRCLGAAVILHWNTIPAKLQQALFEAASSVQNIDHAAPLREVLAQFLHDHKNDTQKLQQQQNGG